MTITANATGEVGGLREQRRALGLSQEKVAQLADCSVSTVRLYENGLNATGPALGRIVHVLLDAKKAQEGAR